MGQIPILFSSAVHPESPRAWLARAAQARRIALMMPQTDAAILEAYAYECESKAFRPATKLAA